MIRKTEKLVITFHTTTEAMAMEEICRKLQAPGRLIPVPRVITAGCGLAWCAEVERETELRTLMDQQKIRYQEVHRCLV